MTSCSKRIAYTNDQIWLLRTHFLSSNNLVGFLLVPFFKKKIVFVTVFIVENLESKNKHEENNYS